MIKIPEDQFESTYCEEYTVMNHDTDAKGDVRPSALLRYMQETANHNMRDCRPTYMELFENGKSFLLSRISVRVYEQLSQYDRIAVQTWPCHDKGLTFNREYRIIRDGRVVAEAASAWALLDTDNGALIRCDGTLLKNYVHAEKLEGLPLRFRFPKTELEEAGEHRVVYHDVDVNYHVNNTNYPDILTDVCGDAQRLHLASMTINYVREAKLGELMKLFHCFEETEEGRVHYVRSLIDGEVNAEGKFVYSF